MPHDPLLADTRAWMERAGADIRCRAAWDERESAVDRVSFHCQQAVEKCLKGLLAWHDIAFRKTHSLEELGEQCLTMDHSLESLVNRAVPLTEYAWKFSYPGEYDEPSHIEANDALRIVDELWEAVLARLPEEARPA